MKRIVRLVLFIGSILLAKCNIVDRDTIPADTSMELELVDSISIESVGFIEYLDYDAVSNYFLFHKSGSQEIILYDISMRRQTVIDFNPDQNPRIGLTLSSGGVDENGKIIIVTDKGGFSSEAPFSSFEKVFEQRAQYPNFINKEIEIFKTDSTEAWAFMNKTYFELSDKFFLPDDPSYFKEFKFFNIYDKVTNDLSIQIGFEENSIFMKNGGANNFPGLGFHYFTSCGLLGCIVNPDSQIHLYDPYKAWKKVKSIDISNLYDWHQFDQVEAKSYGSPKALIVMNGIRSVVSNNNKVLVSYVSSVSAEDYDELYKVHNDFNIVNQELHSQRKKYISLITLGEDCDLQSSLHHCRIPNNLSNAECFISEDKIMFSTDPLLYENPVSSNFYIYKYK